MVKLVQCVSRRPNLSVDEFRTAWEAYGARLSEVATEFGAIRVTLSTTLETQLNEALTEARGSARPFDGIAEVVWPDGAAIVAAAQPGRSGWVASLRATQEEFVDPARSAFFFVHEQQLLGGAQGGPRVGTRRRRPPEPLKSS